MNLLVVSFEVEGINLMFAFIWSLGADPDATGGINLRGACD